MRTWLINNETTIWPKFKYIFKLYTWSEIFLLYDYSRCSIQMVLFNFAHSFNNGGLHLVFGIMELFIKVIFVKVPHVVFQWIYIMPAWMSHNRDYSLSFIFRLTHNNNTSWDFYISFAHKTMAVKVLCCHTFLLRDVLDFIA